MCVCRPYNPDSHFSEGWIIIFATLLQQIFLFVRADKHIVQLLPQFELWKRHSVSCSTFFELPKEMSRKAFVRQTVSPPFPLSLLFAAVDHGDASVWIPQLCVLELLCCICVFHSRTLQSSFRATAANQTRAVPHIFLFPPFILNHPLCSSRKPWCFIVSEGK